MFKKAFQFSIFCFIVFVFSCNTTKPKDENFLGDFNSVSMGEVMGASVSRTKHTLSPCVISFIFEPKVNLLSFHHKYLGDNIWVTLNYENRQVMLQAINEYLETYKTGSLDAKNSKKKAYFGQTRAKMNWGLLGVTHVANPNIRFEYELFGEKKLPYFIVASATHTAEGKDQSNSPAIRIALSPAKCQQVLKRLEQDNLLKIVEELEAEFREFEPEDFKDETSKNIKGEIEKNSSESKETIKVDENSFDF